MDAGAISNLHVNITALRITNTTEIQPSVYHGYPKGLLEFGVACCVLFVIMGIPGNLLAVIALVKSPKLKNATTAFIVNLCLADAFFCATNTPMVASNFLHREWIQGLIMCEAFATIRFTNITLSVLTVLAITINRYVLICHPTKYHKIFTKCNMTIMIILLWLASLALLFPTLIGVWGEFGYDPAVGDCTILMVNGKSPKTFFFSVLYFALPTMIFLICYARIYWVVRKCSRNFQPSDLRVKKQKKHLRLLKIVAVTYGTFVSCFAPVVFVKVFKKEKDWPVMNVVGYLGLCLSACLNPIIYVAMSKQYRKAYAKLLSCHSATIQSTSSKS